MTSGKRVYPIMQIDWKNELCNESVVSHNALPLECLAYMLPPKSLICVVTTASPIQINANTPENTPVVCSLDLVIDNNKLRRRQKMSGPLSLGISPYTCQPMKGAYHKSQSLKPSLMPPCRTTSASGHLPAIALRPPAELSPSPRSAPPMPPPLCNIPPRRYFGQSTCLIFSHTASKSLERVSQTDSSIVFVGARLSSPGMEELR